MALFSNGVNLKKFSTKLNPKFSQLYFDKKKINIVYAGLHGIAQGLDQLINLGELINGECPNVQIVLVGSGPQKNKLIEKVSLKKK